MATDNERREVANQLRDARPSTYYDEELVDLMKDALLPAYPVETWREPTDVLSALADLIDPTCSMEYGGHVPDSVKDALGVYFCSECGSPIYNDMEPTYCPYCGARVTNGGDA